ncbi:MAG: glycosyltransferase family 2 protein [Gammaproteobacteria bacterium]|nr:glycosyltransferase family 2 protein [Gammaproteobacteria bacterium]
MKPAPTFSLIVPTFNGESCITQLLSSIQQQTIQPDKIVIIDSSSADKTVLLAQQFTTHIVVIDQKDFNHGATRNRAIEHTNSDILVYMTQDAYLTNEFSLENLLKVFENPKIAAAYGRQLPRPQAGPIEAHHRLFNYPPHSHIKTYTSKEKSSIKDAFMSNSFAAYRKQALNSIGGFPNDVILGEDMYATAKLLLNGHSIAYVADALATHSHDYSLIQEFKRYFDIGVFHSREKWITNAFGKSEGEGKKFIISECGFLLRARSMLLLAAVIRNILKYAAYRLGAIEKYIPSLINSKLSMHHEFFKK